MTDMIKDDEEFENVIIEAWEEIKFIWFGLLEPLWKLRIYNNSKSQPISDTLGSLLEKYSFILCGTYRFNRQDLLPEKIYCSPFILSDYSWCDIRLPTLA